jgi:hypothetical protein
MRRQAFQSHWALAAVGDALEAAVLAAFLGMIALVARWLGA